MEDMLYGVESVGCFTGIGLEKVPEERTILNFCHLLERHGLGQVLCESIKEHVAGEGLMLKERFGCSIIAAPPWRKNRTGEGDSEKKQSKKGNQ